MHTQHSWVAYGALGAMALALSGLGGCYYGYGQGLDDEDDAPIATPPSGGSSSGRTVTERGEAERFEGSLGNTERFSYAGSEVQLQRSSTQASVRVDQVNSAARHWVMNRISFSGTGGLNHPSLVPGTRLRFASGSRSPINGLSVSVLGCSGPSLNNFDYDRTADEVEVNVSEGPTADTRRMDYTARFAGPRGAQDVHVSFVYEPR